jgi:hypothetical protein
MDIIQDSLKYYDENNLKYEKYMKKVKYVQYVNSGGDNIESIICIFYDKDKNKLFSSKVEIIGKHYKKFNMWVWAWSIPFLDKSVINTIKNIFLYITDSYNKKGIANANNLIIKQHFMTSRFLISDIIQIDIYCAISSYLSKIELIRELPGYMRNTITNKLTDTFIDITYKNNLSGAYYFIKEPPNINDN